MQIRKIKLSQKILCHTVSWGPFLEGPKKFLHPESHSKTSNFMITALFYSHILNMERDSLHTRSFRRMQLSVCRNRLTENGSAGPESFQGFRETGPSGLLSSIVLEM